MPFVTRTTLPLLVLSVFAVAMIGNDDRPPRGPFVAAIAVTNDVPSPLPLGPAARGAGRDELRDIDLTAPGSSTLAMTPVPSPAPTPEPSPAPSVAPAASVTPAARPSATPGAVPTTPSTEPPTGCPADWFCYPRVGVRGPIVPYTDCSGASDAGTAIRAFTCLSPRYLLGHAYTQMGRITGWQQGDVVFAYGQAFTVTGAITARSCDAPPLPLAPLSMQTSLSPSACGPVLIVQAR